MALQQHKQLLQINKLEKIVVDQISYSVEFENKVKAEMDSLKVDQESINNIFKEVE